MATPQLAAHKKGKGAIRLEVVTPEGQALQEFVDELTAPSVQGTFGVLPGHLPILAALSTGVVTFTKAGETVACAVGPGFVEIADDRAVLITDRYAEKDSIDVVSVRMRLKDLDEKISAWDGDIEDPERHSMLAEELWLAALLELYGDPPPPVVRATLLAPIEPDEEEKHDADDDQQND